MSQELRARLQDMFARALRSHQAGRLQEAEPLYQQVLEADPRHADALHMLGLLALQQGRSAAAIDLIGLAIVHNGQVPAFHNNLASALKSQSRLEEAAGAYRRALALKPDYFEAHYNLGVTLHAMGKLEEAAAAYRRAVSYRRTHADCLGNLGNVLHAQGKLDEAAACYRQALAHQPAHAEVLSNLGNVLRALGHREEAVQCYRRAIAQRGDFPEAHNNLGIVLLEQGEAAAAAAACAEALRLRPAYAEAHFNLGNALREQGEAPAAAAAYARALALEPDMAAARLALATCAIPIFADDRAASRDAAGQFAHALDELSAWNTAHPGQLGKAAGTSQPFYLAYRPWDVTPLLSRYGTLLCQAAEEHWRPASRLGAPPPARARVRFAVVSAQVREHPVWDAILRGIVAHLDTQLFEIFIYHTGSLVDAQTTWARSRVAQFVQGPRPTAAWLAQIAHDRPDVLFYPEVGMDPATAALASLRLAPLQLAAWGHPVSTGMPTIDWFLSGDLLEGPNAAQHYREQLIRLPGTGVCTQAAPVQATPWNGPTREAGAVRFTLCQQPIKFDPGDDALIAAIALATAPSEFWLAAPVRHAWATARLRERLASAFRAVGLDPEAHLRVSPWLTRSEFAGFLDSMDVYLDCPAFSGYTTAAQALQRGVPIVTLEGEFMRQRLAAGLLRQTGLAEGIADRPEDYVRIAVERAEEARSSPGAARERRARIRAAAGAADGNIAAVQALARALSVAVRSTD